MYDEYPTVYKSNINEYLVIWIALGIIALILLIFTLIALSKMFKKANLSAIRAYIPILNLLSLLEMANMSKVYLLLLLIPVVNIPFWIKLNLNLAKLFKKGKIFGIGMSFLPFIYYPILAFSGSEYIGINLVAMEAKNELDKIPVIETDIKEEIQKEENTQIDVGSRGINISIGGGVYQKDYTKTLLNVDEDKKLIDDYSDVKENPTPVKNNVFLTGVVDQEVPNQTQTINQDNNMNMQQSNSKSTTDIFSVNFIKTEEPVNNNLNNTNNGVVGTSVPNNSSNFINNSVNVMSNNVGLNSTPVNNSNFINNPGVNSDGISSISSAIGADNNTENTQPKPELGNFVKQMESIEYNLCPNCGTRLQDGSKVCFICGQKID